MEVRRVSFVPFLARRFFHYGRVPARHKEAPSVCAAGGGFDF